MEDGHDEVQVNVHMMCLWYELTTPSPYFSLCLSISLHALTTRDRRASMFCVVERSGEKQDIQNDTHTHSVQCEHWLLDIYCPCVEQGCAVCCEVTDDRENREVEETYRNVILLELELVTIPTMGIRSHDTHGGCVRRSN